VLAPDQMEAQREMHGPSQVGNWEVMRDEILNRPYLSFELPDEATRALVTRLRRSADGLRSQLNLCFALGMEMQLDRAQSLPRPYLLPDLTFPFVREYIAGFPATRRGFVRAQR